jgi:hypothetical protein
MTAAVTAPPSAEGRPITSRDPVLHAASVAPTLPGGRPWWLRPVDGGVEVRSDARQHQCVTGPGLREMRMSCGAALLTMRLAMSVGGRRPVVALQPDPGQPGLLAVLRRGRPAEPTPDERVLHAAAVPPCVPSSASVGPRAEAPMVRHLLRRAAEIEGAWSRSVTDGNERARLCALLSAPQRARAEALACGTGALLVVIGSHHDLPAGHLQAGQAMQRVLLTASALGLPASVLAGPADLLPARREFTGPAGPGVTPQALLLVGRPVASAHAAYPA